MRSHFFQRDRDLGEIRLELDIVILIQLGKLLIYDILCVDRHIDGRTGIDRIADRDCTIS